jgi:23S rRNA (pseudouridine1915-N3)-methyltransferase
MKTILLAVGRMVQPYYIAPHLPGGAREDFPPKMTFSHQMIRMIFVEQIYSAMTKLRGESYHHE